MIAIQPANISRNKTACVGFVLNNLWWQSFSLAVLVDV